MIINTFYFDDKLNKMININAFIQADVTDLLQESTRFSKRSRIALYLTLVVGFLLGLLSSIIVSVRKETENNLDIALQNVGSRPLASSAI